MAIERRDPLRDMAQLHDKVNRMFEEALSRTSGPGQTLSLTSSAWKPPIDLYEEANGYVLRADLPGVEPADVEVRVEQDRLVLRGERKPDVVRPEAYLRVERPNGRFAVQVALPTSVDRSRIEARHRNGVLRVSLPRKDEKQGGRIQVEG